MDQLTQTPRFTLELLSKKQDMNKIIELQIEIQLLLKMLVLILRYVPLLFQKKPNLCCKPAIYTKSNGTKKLQEASILPL
jgi:hypothetical protein